MIIVTMVFGFVSQMDRLVVSRAWNDRGKSRDLTQSAFNLSTDTAMRVDGGLLSEKSTGLHFACSKSDVRFFHHRNKYGVRTCAVNVGLPKFLHGSLQDGYSREELAYLESTGTYLVRVSSWYLQKM